MTKRKKPAPETILQQLQKAKTPAELYKLERELETEKTVIDIQVRNILNNGHRLLPNQSNMLETPRTKSDTQDKSSNTDWKKWEKDPSRN